MSILSGITIFTLNKISKIKRIKVIFINIKNSGKDIIKFVLTHIISGFIISCITLFVYHTVVISPNLSRDLYGWDKDNINIRASMSEEMIHLLKNIDKGIFYSNPDDIRLESYKLAKGSEEMFVNLCKRVGKNIKATIISIVPNEYPSTNWRINKNDLSIDELLSPNKTNYTHHFYQQLSDNIRKRYLSIQEQIKINNTICNFNYIRILDFNKMTVNKNQIQIFKHHLDNPENDIIMLRHEEAGQHGLSYGLFYLIKFDNSDLIYVIFSYGDHQGDKGKNRINKNPSLRGYRVLTQKEFKNTDFFSYLNARKSTREILEKII